MNTKIDEKAQYSHLNSQTAFRELRLYPRNWNMTEMPRPLNGHSVNIPKNKFSLDDNAQSTLAETEVSFDEWQLTHHLPVDNPDHPEFFTAF